MVKKLLEYIPIITGILIFLGYLNLSSYYDYFGIVIYPYITTGEIITSFLPIVKVTALTLVILYLLPLIVSVVDSILNIVNGYRPEFSKDPRLEMISHLQHKQLFISIFKDPRYKSAKFIDKAGIVLTNMRMFATGISYYFITYYLLKVPINFFISNNPVIYRFFGLLIVLLFIGITIALFIIQVHVKTLIGKNAGFITDLSFNVGFFIFSVVLINQLYNHKEVVKLKAGKPNFKVEFKICDRLIESDSTNIYIGQTQNYLFLYDRRKNKSQAYKISDISILTSTALLENNNSLFVRFHIFFDRLRTKLAKGKM